MKKNEVEETEINLLDLIPVRNIKWKKKEDGLIILLKPKFRHPFITKHILPHLKRPYYKIKLDAVGSFIWELCDGKLSVKEIAQSLKHHFKDEVEPLYDRMALFFQSLEKHRFMFYKGKKE